MYFLSGLPSCKKQNVSHAKIKPFPFTSDKQLFAQTGINYYLSF